MSDCYTEISDHKNNGLITKIWGSPGWVFGHSITFGYPLKPTEEQKRRYKNYFISLGDVLPCKFCRESYQKFIVSGETTLTDAVMENRETLTRWFYKVHEAVNRKLEVDYGITYEDVVQKYESFRAKCGKPNKTSQGCVTPLDYKAFSFEKLYHVDAPIIPIEMVIPFARLARKRNIPEEFFCFFELATLVNGDFAILKKQECWKYRNDFCQLQIKRMRENAIPSIISEGKYQGTPTIDELLLLLFLSSNLNRSEILEASNKIPNN